MYDRQEPAPKVLMHPVVARWYRSSRPFGLAILACLLLAAPVLAKVNAEVRLDAAIPADVAPGSTIEVGFTVTTPGAAGVAISHMPVFIRLLAKDPTGGAAEAIGEETHPGSGHRVAVVTVPAEGIAGVEAGIRNESCTAQDGCTRVDHLFLIVGATIAPVGVVVLVITTLASRCCC